MAKAPRQLMPPLPPPLVDRLPLPLHIVEQKTRWEQPWRAESDLAGRLRVLQLAAVSLLSLRGLRCVGFCSLFFFHFEIPPRSIASQSAPSAIRFGLVALPPRSAAWQSTLRSLSFIKQTNMITSSVLRKACQQAKPPRGVARRLFLLYCYLLLHPLLPQHRAGDALTRVVPRGAGTSSTTRRSSSARCWTRCMRTSTVCSGGR